MSRIGLVMTGALAVVAVTGVAGLAQQVGVVTRGAPIGQSPLVRLADVLHDTEVFLDRTVTVEGVVTKVCQMKGCWMEIRDGSATGVRVTFKDYGFFVPTDSRGRVARLEGEFETNRFSRQDADHLIAEGVRLRRNPDGTAMELSFVASGVELQDATASLQ